MCLCVVCLAATYLVLSNPEATPTPTSPPPVSIDQVVNIQWQWVELFEGDPASQSAVPNPELYVVVFRPDGQLHVTADCNVANGAYRAEGSWLAVNMGPLTTAQCPEGSLSVQFVGLLVNVDSFGLEGDHLVLGLRDAAGRMIFRNGGPAEAGPPAPTATPTPTGEAVPEPTATAGPAPTATAGPEPTPTAGDLPQPVIVAPSEAKPREAVIFDGSQSQPGSSPITGYGWDFGDGGSAEGAIVNHVYAQPGSYTVILTVRDEAGMSNSATTQIDIREAGAPAPGPTSEAEGELIGPAWQWTELNQDVPTLVPNPERYTLRFLGAGALEYVADCALGRATYAIQNDGLRIDLGATSPPACGPGSLSTQYLALLQSVVTFERDAERLNLYIQGGRGHMAFFTGAE
jgi:heat shock protein HslJ